MLPSESAQILAKSIMFTSIGTGTSKVSSAVHPLASVTVTIYVPPNRPVISSVSKISPLDPSQLYI